MLVTRIATAPRAVWLIGAGLILGLVIALSFGVGGPSSSVDPTSPRHEPARIQEHLRAIAALPRPAGGAEAVRSRNYLVEQLAASGLRPRVQTVVGSEKGWDGNVKTEGIHNVLVTIEGMAERPGLLFAAHYDSVPWSPGAADNASAVAAMLEVARVLAAGPPPDVSIHFLFTDGEELGRVGALAFARGEPFEPPEVSLVVNFDARGNRGPLYLVRAFRASDALLDEVATVAPGLRGTSTMARLMDQFGQDTDASAFASADADAPVLDFAIIEGVDVYHSPLDDMAHLDVAVPDAQAALMLGLARHFTANGGAAMTPQATEPARYVCFGGRFIALSSTLSWLLVGVAAAAASLRLRAAAKALGPVALLRGAGVFLLVSSVMVATGWIAWRSLLALDGRLRSGELSLTHPPYLLGLAALFIGVMAIAWHLASARVTAPTIQRGSMLVTLVVGLWLSVNEPGLQPIVAVLLLALAALHPEPSTMTDGITGFVGGGAILMIAIPWIDELCQLATLSAFFIVMAALWLILAALLPYLRACLGNKLVWFALANLAAAIGLTSFG